MTGRPGGVERGFAQGRVADLEGRPRSFDQESWPVVQRSGGQPIAPTQQSLNPPGVDGRPSLPLDQIGGSSGLAGPQVMVEGRVDIPAGFRQLGGAPVEATKFRRVFPLQTVLKELLKERVIPIPVGFSFQSEEEQVTLVEGG